MYPLEEKQEIELSNISADTPFTYYHYFEHHNYIHILKSYIPKEVSYQYEYEIHKIDNYGRPIWTVSTFEFYTLESFFQFVTNEHNCLDINSFPILKLWYDYGIIPASSLHIYHKNRHIFNRTYFCNECDECGTVLELDESFSYSNPMYTLKKISIIYFINIWSSLVFPQIRVPVICHSCIRVRNETFHLEWTRKMLQWKHTYITNVLGCLDTYLHSYDLYEPKLNKNMIQYIIEQDNK